MVQMLKIRLNPKNRRFKISIPETAGKPMVTEKNGSYGCSDNFKNGDLIAEGELCL